MTSEYKRLIGLIQSKEGELRVLKSQKKALDEKLLSEMTIRKVESINGISKSTLVKKPRISISEKDKLSIQKLQEIGVQNPQKIVEELKKVGKSNKNNNK